MTGFDIPWSRRKVLAATVAAPAAAALGACAARADTPPRPTVFGVNCYGLFMQPVVAGKPAQTGALADLARAGIKFVRFPVMGQHAADWNVFDKDPVRFWGTLDTVFAAAEHNGIHLIPSLFWNTPALPFHLGGYMSDYAKPGSRTRVFVDRYIDEFALRYDASPALLMYEFGNEMNVTLDLPTQLKYFPKIDASMPGRVAVPEDLLGVRQFVQIADAFSSRLSLHSTRPRDMGTDLQAFNAWHLARGGWMMDTAEQTIDYMRNLVPPGIDTLSIHFYKSGFGSNRTVFARSDDLAQAFVEACRRDNRRSLIGEFGAERNATPGQEQQLFNTLLASIIGAKVNYAALWNYAPVPLQPEFDVTLTNDRAYQIEAIAAANRG